jgi:hypothetical protein
MKTARPLMGLVAAILSTQIAAGQTLDDPRMPPDQTESSPSAPASVAIR